MAKPSRIPARRTAEAPAPPPRGGPARPLGALLPAVGGVAFRRFGFVHSELLTRWSDIVGPAHARWSVPESLRFPKGQSAGGILTVRVEGPFATQMQHLAPVVVERVNRIFGHGAVARLKLVQGRVPRADVPAAPAPDPAAADAANLRDIADGPLRQSLEALAALVARAAGPPRVG
jgi:hypothetical protein